jgi:uncharacterized RDD family membrane protein YckC
MEIEDRHVTSTPEGVSLSVVLAGAGSRASAYIIDFAVQIFTILVAAFALFSFVHTTTAEYVATGAFAFVSFGMLFGYFILFETFGGGRSLGKLALGLRVARLDGSGVRFRESLVRNLMRILYAIPLFYLVDGALIVWSSRNQRLGDLLAGTIVVRERFGDVQEAPGTLSEDRGYWSGAQVPNPAWAATSPPLPGTQSIPWWLEGWDVTAVTAADVTLIRTFLERRNQYEPGARIRLAQDLASRIGAKVAGVAAPIHPEAFLEGVVILKTARG